MENRLKERLTGAAILVALIVVLVPQMFRGQGGETSPVTSSSGDGAPVRSYTIDLSNNPKSSAPLQSTASTGASNNTDSSANPSSNTASPSAPAAPAPQPSPVPTPAAPLAQQPAAAPAPKVHTQAPAPSPSPPPAAKAPAGGAWSVQLGLFSKHENAEKMLSEAKAKGFNVAISTADPKGMFHVHAVGLADRAAAQALVQRLKDQGLPGAVVGP